MSTTASFEQFQTWVDEARADSLGQCRLFLTNTQDGYYLFGTVEGTHGFSDFRVDRHFADLSSLDEFMKGLGI